MLLGGNADVGGEDKYENRTGLLDILDDIRVDGMLVHSCYRLDMDLLRRLTDCDGRFLVRHYLVGHVPTLVHDICMTLGSFLLRILSNVWFLFAAFRMIILIVSCTDY